MHTFRNAGLALALLAGLTAATARPAHAQNLVQDGTFEAADPAANPGVEISYASTDAPFDSSWTITSGVAAIDTQNQYVYDGEKSLYLDDDTTTVTTVQQKLVTTPGTRYTLTFYANDEGNNPLTVAVGDTTFPAFIIPQNGYPNTDFRSNTGAFTLEPFDFTATSALTTLSFSAGNAGNGLPAIELDNISVVPNAAPVPEASTVASTGLLLGLGGLAARRRKKRAA